MLGTQEGYAWHTGGVCLAHRRGMLGTQEGYAWHTGGVCLAHRRGMLGTQGYIVGT